MQVRFLGHSCIEIIGKHHIIIDPDFIRQPEPGVDFILVTHAHLDHIARIAEIKKGKVVASPETCNIASSLGVSEERLFPGYPGMKIGNVSVLPGFSEVNGPLYTFFYFIYKRSLPNPGGTPLSFLIEDEVTLLHIGDAYKVNLEVKPDILCLLQRLQ